MKAKDFLKQLQKLDKLIENKISEKAYWMGIACSTTAPASRTVKIKNSKDKYEEHAMTRVKSSSNQQKMSDAISRYIDIEADIDACIDRLYDEKKKVLAVIEQLDVIEYDILYKVYVGIVQNDKLHYLDLNEVAALYDKSRSWADTMHGIALKHVQEIIDNCEKL